MENTKKVIRISRKKLIVLVIIVIVGFLLLKENRYKYDIPPMMGTTESRGSGNGVSAPSMPDYYPYPGDTSSAKDTREFMKVSYGAEIKTRDVKDVMGDVKNAIRDAEGRIDNISETTKYGYVNFVVPKSNFNNFKAEIEAITHEKLYTENSSSTNLLGQKQSIEEQEKSINTSLIDVKNRQKSLTAQHNQIVASLQKEIDNTPQSDQQRIASLQASLNNENADYAKSNQNYKNQISDLNLQLANVKKQDVAFTDNIETVNGYISVNWVSLWEMSKLLSPIHPTIVIIILALGIWYPLSRKNYLPTIEFV